MKAKTSARHWALETSATSSIPVNCASVGKVLLSAVLAAASANLLAASTASTNAQEWAKGRILVMPRAGLSESELGKIVGVHGGKARQIGTTRLYVVSLPSTASETAVAEQLSHNPHLKFAELDRRVKSTFTPNDPYAGSEWHLAKIGVPVALDISQGAGVTIAVLDTGVDAVPDLAAQLVPGWNFYDSNSNTADVNGHGTAVAGAAAAATNNGVGVASIAGQSKVMPIRVADSNAYAYWSAIADGITYAADHGARVANVSYVGLVPSATIQTASLYMKSKGGLVLVAAGNNGIDEGFTPTTSMIPVSATDSNDQITSWSSYGSYVAMSAPGLNIWTTQRGGSYAAWWGTSLATPVTAGTVALMMSANPKMASTQIESLLYSTALDLGTSGRDKYYGYGRVNAAAAVQAAAGATATVDAQAPTASISDPLAGTSVSGLVTVNASASDNVGVARVELRVNGSTVATDTTSPFAFTWDSTTIANGVVTLSAVAYDAAGNAGTSQSVSVNVANTTTSTSPGTAPPPAGAADVTPPVVTIVSPAAGATMKGKGSTNISTSASDNGGSAGITQSLYIDGVFRTSMTGSSLSYSWNLRKVSSGTHTITVIATDAAGNQATTSEQVSK